MLHLLHVCHMCVSSTKRGQGAVDFVAHSWLAGHSLAGEGGVVATDLVETLQRMFAYKPATADCIGAGATDTPRSRTNFTASTLNSRLNFGRSILVLQFQKHLILVSM